jgi:hypothetical protein
LLSILLLLVAEVVALKVVVEVVLVAYLQDMRELLLALLTL